MVQNLQIHGDAPIDDFSASPSLFQMFDLSVPFDSMATTFLSLPGESSSKTLMSGSEENAMMTLRPDAFTSSRRDL
jgi:hypothetical protein